jgi:hypothetical protein
MLGAKELGKRAFALEQAAAGEDAEQVAAATPPVFEELARVLTGIETLGDPAA